jgi:hypothetical protein
MNSSTDLNLQFELGPEAHDSATFARAALSGRDAAARGEVVNRTHRVVRQRAKVMQERRSHVRSLMVPLAICSVLLILVCTGVWTGLYEYQAAEAVEADIAALDANNHLLVVLLWFVPVMLALLGVVLFRSVRNGSDRETIR